MIFQSQDKQIQDFLQKSEVSKKYSWNNSVISGTSTSENPFNFLIIKDLNTKEGFKEKPMIKMFSDNCFSIDFTDNITESSKISNDQNIIYKNEISTTNEIPQPNKEASYSVASSFISRFNLEPYFHHPVTKFKIKETQIFTVSLSNFEIKGSELFEPILFTAFLLNEKLPNSEFWNFVPNPTQILMEKLNNPVQLNQKAAFHIGSTSLHTSLVILITRIAQPHHGAACDKAYSKNTSSQLKAVQESMSHTFDNLFQPFGVTFAPLADILAQCTSGEPFIMPAPCEIDISKTKLNDLSTLYQNTPKYPFQISLTGKMQITTDQSSTLKDGYIELQSLGASKPGPNFQFHHKLTITISSSTFSKKPTKDVYCIVSYCEGGFKGKRKPYIRAKYTNKLVSTANSFASKRCEKSIVFNDQFTIELPPTIAENTYITFEFMSLSFKKHKQELIGISVMPIMINGGFIKDGKKKLAIFDSLDTLNESEWKATSNQNKHVICTHLFSSLVSTDSQLNELFEGKNVDLSNSDPNELLRNIFQVVDVLTNRIKTNDSLEAIKSLEKVAFRIAPVYDEFEEFLMFYALRFSLRCDQSKSFHNNLLSSWGEKLAKDASKSGSERFDSYLVDFYFILIIKSIYVTKDDQINDSLIEFTKNLAVSIPPLVKNGLLQAKKFCQSFGHFLNMLSEIGFYSLILDCLEIFINSFGDTESDQSVVDLLLYSTFTPKLFCVMILNCEKLSKLCTSFVEKAKNNPLSVHYEAAFTIFLKLFSFYDEKTSQLVADKLMDSLTPLCELYFSLATNKGRMSHSCFFFFLFLIGNSSLEPFKKWWKSVSNSIQSTFFEFIHFLIDNVKDKENDQNALKNLKLNLSEIEKLCSNTSRSYSPMSTAKNRVPAQKSESEPATVSSTSQPQKEIRYSMEFSILHVLNLIQTIVIPESDKRSIYSPSKPLTVFSQVSKVIYHLLSSNFALDTLPVISEMINGFASNNVELLFNQCCPVLPKFIIKVIQNGRYWPDLLSFLDVLHASDIKEYKNDNRTMAVVTRAIYMLPQGSSDSLKLIKSGFIQDFITQIAQFDTLLSDSIQFEDHCDILYSKSELLKSSPDSRYEVLSQLASLEHSQEYYAEEIQVYLLQASIAIEYLVLLGKIPKSLFDLEDAAEVMNCLSHVSKSAFCSMKKDELPIIPSFCDSPYFTFYSLTQLFDKIISTCSETRYFETSGDLVDLIWPLLENRRSFSLLHNMMLSQADSFTSLSKIAPNEDRLFGKYYRVSFYGKLFEKNDNAVFIYREKKLTHLYEISSRIVDSFKKLHGEEKIELIKESGPVDVKSLDPNMGYIQVTFVEPFKNSPNCSSQFFFDTPFIKGEDTKKAQGTVDQQWLRRTVLVVNEKMPFVVKRQKVANIKTIEIEPIRVSYRQLRERVAAMREAVNSQDMRQVQQLLHGSLLVQVNEGPTKMAEVFLGNSKAETKYTLKMKNEFREFLNVNQQGLKLHARWCMENTEFIPLQRELDSGFQSLKEKLEAYLK